MPSILWTAKSAIEMFRPGMVVWRNVRLYPRLHDAEGYNLRAELDPLLPTPTADGTLLRVNAPGMFIGEPEAIVCARWGIVAFVQGRVSPDWTHLIVENAVQKAEGGGYITLRQYDKMSVGDYCAMRAAMAEAYLPLIGSSGKEPLSVLDLFDSFAAPVMGSRLFVAYDSEQHLFAYRTAINSEGWVQ